MRWAKCEEIKSGSKVRAHGIECCGTDVLEVQYDGRYEEFFVTCREGLHFLDGQKAVIDDEDVYLGIELVE